MHPRREGHNRWHDGTTMAQDDSTLTRWTVDGMCSLYISIDYIFSNYYV